MELLKQVKERHGEAIKAEWRSMRVQVKRDIEEAGSSIKKDFKISSLANQIGAKLGLAMDSGGTDVGARNRQVVLDCLEEVMREDV